MFDHGQSWPSLSEAAKLTGYSREALRTRVRRGKLRAVKGNDGITRLDPAGLTDLPPPDVTEVDHGRPGGSEDDLPTGDQGLTMADLWDHLGQARSDLVKANADHLVAHGRAERAEAEAAGLGEALSREALRADEAEKEAERVGQERDQSRQEREEARVRAAAAEGETKALREA